MAFEVSTPVFEGPFDLLLHLITKDQVDIYEISLARIVDAFVAEMDRLANLDLEVATEFLLIAATLVELKLRRLLPDRDGIELDEDLSLLEERDLLLAKLLECATFKESARMLARLLERGSRSYPRTAGPGEEFVRLLPDLLEGVSADDLAAAYNLAMTRAMTPKPVPRVSTDHVTPIRMTVAETVDSLAVTLAERSLMSFREITAMCAARIDVIVHFLAILELYKQGWVELDQVGTFGEMTVQWCPDGASGGSDGESWSEDSWSDESDLVDALAGGAPNYEVDSYDG